MHAARKSTVYFDEKSWRMLERLRVKTGDSNSDIIKNALWFYADLDSHIEAIMRRVVAEELKKALEGLIVKEAK